MSREDKQSAIRRHEKCGEQKAAETAEATGNGGKRRGIVWGNCTELQLDLHGSDPDAVDAGWRAEGDEAAAEGAGKPPRPPSMQGGMGKSPIDQNYEVGAQITSYAVRGANARREAAASGGGKGGQRRRQEGAQSPTNDEEGAQTPSYARAAGSGGIRRRKAGPRRRQGGAYSTINDEAGAQTPAYTVGVMLIEARGANRRRQAAASGGGKAGQRRRQEGGYSSVNNDAGAQTPSHAVGVMRKERVAAGSPCKGEIGNGYRERGSAPEELESEERWEIRYMYILVPSNEGQGAGDGGNEGAGWWAEAKKRVHNKCKHVAKALNSNTDCGTGINIQGKGNGRNIHLGPGGPTQPLRLQKRRPASGQTLFAPPFEGTHKPRKSRHNILSYMNEFTDTRAGRWFRVVLAIEGRIMEDKRLISAWQHQQTLRGRQIVPNNLSVLLTSTTINIARSAASERHMYWVHPLGLDAVSLRRKRFPDGLRFPPFCPLSLRSSGWVMGSALLEVDERLQTLCFVDVRGNAREESYGRQGEPNFSAMQTPINYPPFTVANTGIIADHHAPLCFCHDVVDSTPHQPSSPAK
ncbi:hypothetical protein C8R47DRAFT_1075721 [Mycena vitilis]|nr:hypothetical protein C8R47DRAFT_1075721 [Mycena vitilis]